MLIYSPHNFNLCLDSQETRFSWNVFEAFQYTRAASSSDFIPRKNTPDSSLNINSNLETAHIRHLIHDTI